MSEKIIFQPGDKVIMSSEDTGTVYDFGYYAKLPGRCIIYKEGERNMQDSYGVKTSVLILLRRADKK